MTKFIGNTGVVKIGANALGNLTEFSVQEQAAVADSSAIGDAADTHIPGSTNWSASVTAWWDEADTAQAAAIVGASLTFAGYLDGITTGKHYVTGTGTITSVGSAVRRNQTIQRTLSVTGNGALTRSVAP